MGEPQTASIPKGEISYPVSAFRLTPIIYKTFI